MINSESFVLYESTFKQFERLMNRGKKEQALAFIKATMEFGLYGVIPDDNDDVWDYGLEQTFTSISAAKDRYAASIENGKKGGRPIIELVEAEVMAKKAELKTWKAVATHFGVTEQTLRNKRSEWEKQKNQKNLNENVNVNVNDNVNKNENKNENAIFSDKHIQMYKALDGYVGSNGECADEIEELLETACYWNNPIEKLETMTAADLVKLETYYNKYCS
jgi:hypothetical protein